MIADPWLLDPRWNLLADELDIATLGTGYLPEQDEEGMRLDYLFALTPHTPALLDEVIVVEIKRGTDRKGNLRKADVDEVNKFHGYVLAVKDYYDRSTDRPLVRGLMIAQSYTAGADRVRRSLEEAQAVRLAFRTWDRVIDETERMHMGWLEVSKDRAGERP